MATKPLLSVALGTGSAEYDARQTVGPETVAHDAYGETETTQLDHALQLLATLPAMLFISRPDGDWDYVNPAFCAYTGQPAEALTSQGWAEVVHTDDRAASLMRWQASMRSGVPFLIEHRLRGADGGYRWFRTEATPQRNVAGVCMRWAGIATPVARDAQLEAERALRQTAEHARDASDSVLAIAAHELRGPLTVLLGQAKLLQRRLEAREGADPGDRHTADTLVEQTLRLSGLAHALLEVSQIDHGELHISPTAIDLSALVRRVVQTLQPVFPSHTLRLHEEVEPLLVMGDALRLEQVLQNLLQNAVNYSPAGGEIAIAATADAQQARITVRDHGMGIAASIRPYVFQRFFRARVSNGRKPGLGLGLFICKTIMDLHGGSIEVESVEGEGSTFTLRLPRIWR